MSTKNKCKGYNYIFGTINKTNNKLTSEKSLSISFLLYLYIITYKFVIYINKETFNHVHLEPDTKTPRRHRNNNR